MYLTMYLFDVCFGGGGNMSTRKPYKGVKLAMGGFLYSQTVILVHAEVHPL